MIRTAAFTISLLLSGAAIAQATDTYSIPDAMPAETTASDLPRADSAPMATTTAVVANPAAPASGEMVQPSNANPERDAHGIAVISAAATVPAGFNGMAAGDAVGGPLLDPATGAPIMPAANDYPACSATVTDHCLQAYERGRS